MVVSAVPSHDRDMTSTTACPPAPFVRPAAAATTQVRATGVVDELVRMVLRAPELDLHHDPVLVDRLESLALALWDELHLRLGLARWTATSPPSHRWVALERSVGRLHQRLDEPRLRELVVGPSTLEALRAARAGWERTGAGPLRP